MMHVQAVTIELDQLLQQPQNMLQDVELQQGHLERTTDQTTAMDHSRKKKMKEVTMKRNQLKWKKKQKWPLKLNRRLMIRKRKKTQDMKLRQRTMTKMPKL